MHTLDPPRFYCGRQPFRVFELLLSCDLNWSPVSPSAFLFCHICGPANSTWTYYSKCNSIVIMIPYIYYYTGIYLESLHLFSIRDPFKIIDVYCYNATEQP